MIKPDIKIGPWLIVFKGLILITFCDDLHRPILTVCADELELWIQEWWPIYAWKYKGLMPQSENRRSRLWPNLALRPMALSNNCDNVIIEDSFIWSEIWFMFGLWCYSNMHGICNIIMWTWHVILVSMKGLSCDCPHVLRIPIRNRMWAD